MAGLEEAGLEFELFEIAGLAAAFLHRLEDALGPRKAAPAGRTPSTGFLREEMLEVPQHADGAGAVVEHDHGAGAEPAAGLLHFVEVHRHIEVLFGEELGGGAAGEEAAEPVARAHAAGVLLQDLADGGSHRKFPKAGAVQAAARAVEFGAAIGCAAQLAEPGCAAVDDVGDIAERLDVVDGGRLAPEPRDGGVGRLGARVGALALERVEHAGLFAAHVAAGADVQVEIEGVAGAEDVAAEEVGRIGFGDGGGDEAGGQSVFGAEEDVGDVGAGGVARDDGAFDQLVGIAFEQQAILERAGLHLIGIDDEVTRVRRVFRDQGPLEAGREACAAAAAQIGVLDLFDDRVRCEIAQRLAERLVAARALVRGAVRRRGPWPDVLCERRFHGLGIPLQNAIDLRGFEIVVEVVVDHHDGRVIASAEADNRQQGETAVSGTFAGADPEAFGDVAELPLAVHDPAAHAVADVDDVPAHGLAEDQVVEGGDGIELGGGHPEEGADVLEGFVGDPAAMLLHDAHGVDADGVAGGVVGKFVFDFAALVFAQHRASIGRRPPGHSPGSRGLPAGRGWFRRGRAAAGSACERTKGCECACDRRRCCRR